jgi:hygromycin-B 4-O-kinase
VGRAAAPAPHPDSQSRSPGTLARERAGRSRLSLAKVDPQVRAFLAQRGAQNVERAGRGDWSVAYGFRLDGAELVARFGPEREDFEKDRLAARHASPALPIPRLVEIGETNDGAYAISERAHGVHLETLDEDSMRALLPGLFAALDALRLADVSGTAGYGGWDGTGDAPHGTWQEALLVVGEDEPGGRVHPWREPLASSRLGAGPFDEALACLRELGPRLPGHRHLTHNDLLNRNVLVAGGRIAAVLDWACSMYGDFLYELAGLTFWRPWFAWGAIDLAAEAERHYEAIGLDVPGFAERLRAYEIRVGLDGWAYNAFRGRWDEVERIARRTLAAVEGQPVNEPT